MGIKEIVLGDSERYNYTTMCMPNNPCSTKEKPKLNFYTKDEKVPLLLAVIMGLQHALAMVGGLITPPLVVFKFSVCFDCLSLQQYAVSAALITSGVCSLIHVSKIPIPFTARLMGRQMYIGAGVLTVMGTSFTFLPIYESSIAQMRDSGVDGTVAYGNMLGTSMVCCLFGFCFSCVPVRIIKRIFPPLVTAVTVILIGVGLIGTGMKYWGGGVVCADMGWKEHIQVVEYEPPIEFPPPGPICTNGEVMLGYGSPQYIGLGFSVMCGLVVIEIFGSTFMKNCNVFLALMFGFFVAAVSNYEGLNYVNSEAITSAPAITFLWVYTFPIGFYAPALIPMLIAFMVTIVETIGDLTAVYEVSELDTATQAYQETIQGGITSDSFGSLLAALFTSMPTTTFAQNNGVISMTKCASRRAGYACGCWLLVMGIFGKIAGIITSIPDAVLGGMTIFLFANVLTSGLSLAATLDLHSRRVKFILAMSLAIGIGVNVWPYAFLDMRASFYTANFWRCGDCNDVMKGLRNGVAIFLSHGYCVGTVVAMLLNAILPEDVGVNTGREGDLLEENHDTKEIEKSVDEVEEELKMVKNEEAVEENDVTGHDANDVKV